MSVYSLLINVLPKKPSSYNDMGPKAQRQAEACLCSFNYVKSLRRLFTLASFCVACVLLGSNHVIKLRNSC